MQGSRNDERRRDDGHKNGKQMLQGGKKGFAKRWPVVKSEIKLFWGVALGIEVAFGVVAVEFFVLPI